MNTNSHNEHTDRGPGFTHHENDNCADIQSEVVCSCECHTNFYFDEPHAVGCTRDGLNPNMPYTHPKAVTGEQKASRTLATESSELPPTTVYKLSEEYGRKRHEMLNPSPLTDTLDKIPRVIDIVLKHRVQLLNADRNAELANEADSETEAAIELYVSKSNLESQIKELKHSKLQGHIAGNLIWKVDHRIEVLERELQTIKESRMSDLEELFNVVENVVRVEKGKITVSPEEYAAITAHLSKEIAKARVDELKTLVVGVAVEDLNEHVKWYIKDRIASLENKEEEK